MNRQSVEHESRPGQVKAPEPVTMLAGLPVKAEPADEQPARHEPNREIDSGADQKERLVQVALLLAKLFARLQQFRVHPGIDVGQSDGDRQESNGQERQRADAAFQHGAKQETPGAAGQRVDHQQYEASEPQAQIELVSCQVGSKELLRIEPTADGAEGEDPGADQQRQP